MPKILIVEDDDNLGSIVERWLVSEHHQVDRVTSGLTALDHLRSFHCDLAIVDWQLPGLSGIEMCKQVHQLGIDVRILMLTGKNTIDNKAEAYNIGIDDYLTKPFHIQELLMRVRALLKRPVSSTETLLKIADLVLDPQARRLTKSGKEVHVSPREFDLLEFLLRHPETVFSAEALLARIWESDSDTTQATVRTFIKQLRKKLDSDGQPSIIENVHGVGYRLQTQAD